MCQMCITYNIICFMIHEFVEHRSNPIIQFFYAFYKPLIMLYPPHINFFTNNNNHLKPSLTVLLITYKTWSQEKPICFFLYCKVRNIKTHLIWLLNKRETQMYYQSHIFNHIYMYIIVDCICVCLILITGIIKIKL